jgi:hypothetical protein
VGLLHYYCDKDVPRDLFRGQSKTEAKQGLPILYPNSGFTRRDGTQRPPDVEIVEVNGNKVVKGCRTIRGEYRGVSTFDRKITSGAGFTWYKLPKATPIPEALAITQNSDYPPAEAKSLRRRPQERDATRALSGMAGCAEQTPRQRMSNADLKRESHR